MKRLAPETEVVWTGRHALTPQVISMVRGTVLSDDGHAVFIQTRGEIVGVDRENTFPVAADATQAAERGLL